MTATSSLARMACIVAPMAGIASAALAVEYVPADTKISGKEIFFFEDAGQNVTLVLGEVRVINEHLDETYRQLKPAFK